MQREEGAWLSESQLAGAVFHGEKASRGPNSIFNELFSVGVVVDKQTPQFSGETFAVIKTHFRTVRSPGKLQIFPIALKAGLGGNTGWVKERNDFEAVSFNTPTKGCMRGERAVRKSHASHLLHRGRGGWNPDSRVWGYI